MVALFLFLLRVTLEAFTLTFTIKNIYITKRQKIPLLSCQTDSCSVNLSRFSNDEFCFRFADNETLTIAQTNSTTAKTLCLTPRLNTMPRERSKKLRHRLKITAVRCNFARATIEDSPNLDSMHRHNSHHSTESRGRVHT